MTSDDLAALLRADPDRAVRAIQLAKVAGPWQNDSTGQLVRHGWSAQIPRREGLRVAADWDAAEAHDADLLREGWTLARGLLK